MKIKTLLLISFLGVVIVSPQRSEAVLIDAYDLAGQIDGSGDPIWTQSAINNGGGAISNAGFQIGTSYGGNNMDVDVVNSRLFVVDNGNSRVLVFDLDENNDLVDRYADNVLGQADFSSGNNNRGGSVAVNTLSGPRGIAYDSDRDLIFVGDTNNNRVLVYDVATITNGEDAIYVLGYKDFTNSVIGDTALNPWGLEYDQVNKRLFVTDETAGTKIQVFDVTSIADGEAAVSYLGTGVSGSGLNQFDFDVFSHYDPTEDRLFVADEGNSRVLVFDVSTIVDEESAINFIGSGTTPAQNSLPDAKGPFYDPETGTLFVTDHDNGERVMLFDISNGVTNGMDAYNVLGHGDFDSGTYVSTTRDTFQDPHGIYYDTGSNKLYILEERNNRVTIFQFPNATSTLADGEVSAAYSEPLSATGGTGPYTYSLASGSSLPDGLSLSSDGTISGTPTESGDFIFTVIVEDSSVTAPETTGLRGGTELSLTIADSSEGGNDVENIIEEDHINKNSKEYKKYKEYRRKYSGSPYKKDYWKVKEMKKKDYPTYLKMKAVYYIYKIAGDEARENLEKNDPENYEMYKEYRRYKKYKQYKDYKDDVF